MSSDNPEVFTDFPLPTSTEDIVPVPVSDKVSDPARLVKLVKFSDLTVVVPSYTFVPETTVVRGRIVMVNVPFVRV